MKKTIKLALVASLALGTTSAFATNGTALIGFGAKSRGMGGTGIAQFQGSESGFNNPALIGYAEKNEASIGGTYFAPTVTFEDNAAQVQGAPAGDKASAESKAGAGMIPAISTIDKVNDNYAWGLALYGVGGMGVDYRDATETQQAFPNPGFPDGGANALQANDNLLLMRFALPLAYTTHGFSVGVAPLVEYGALSMNIPAFGQAGVTTDIAMGFEVGLAYQIAGVTLGFDYKSKIVHDYEETFTSASATGELNHELATPSVVGIGVSYEIAGSTIALDYKSIGYADAEGFDDFGWENQSVIGIGYEYSAATWAARVGYNYGEQPINLASATDSAAAQNATTGSLMMFPGVTESHYTVGGSYIFSEMVSLDAAFVYGTGTAESTTFSGGAVPYEIEVTNDQISVTAALNYNF